MAGAAPTDFESTRVLDAGPVHCSVWLSRIADGPQFFAVEVPEPDGDSVRAGRLYDIRGLARSVEYLHDRPSIAQCGWPLIQPPSVVMVGRMKQLRNLHHRVLGEWLVHAG